MRPPRPAWRGLRSDEIGLGFSATVFLPNIARHNFVKSPIVIDAFFKVGSGTERNESAALTIGVSGSDVFRLLRKVKHAQLLASTDN